jgi:hypothetical protein
MRIEQLKFKKTDNENFLCGAEVYIGCELFLAEALRVRYTKLGVQYAYHLDYEDQLNNYRAVAGSHENLRTVQIPGHPGDWVVVIVPAAA